MGSYPFPATLTFCTLRTRNAVSLCCTCPEITLGRRYRYLTLWAGLSSSAAARVHRCPTVVKTLYPIRNRLSNTLQILAGYCRYTESTLRCQRLADLLGTVFHSPFLLPEQNEKPMTVATVQPMGHAHQMPVGGQRRPDGTKASYTRTSVGKVA